MTFPITVGIGGYSGWLVLQRREERQMELLSRDPVVQRNTSHFRDRIEVMSSVDELLGDYRSLSVALGAFGLEEEIGKRGFIKKVLESDLSDQRSLANRLSDKRYLKLAQAFGFLRGKDEGKQVSTTKSGGLENAPWMVGLTNQKRDFAREVSSRLEGLHQKNSTNESIWLAINSDPKLARTFSGALKLGDQHFRLPPEEQFADFQKKILSKYGIQDLNDITTPRNIGRIAADFFARDGSVYQRDEEVARAFEFRVGSIHRDEETRGFLLDVRRELQELSTTGSNDPEQWSKVQNSPDLRKFFSQAFGFGEDLAKLSVGEQAKKHSEAANWLLGSPSLSALSQPENLEHLLQTYLFNVSKTLQDAGQADGFTPDSVFDFTAGLLDQDDDTRKLVSEAGEEIQKFLKTDGADKKLIDLVQHHPSIRKIVEGGLQVTGDYREATRGETVKKLDTAAERLLGTSSAVDFADKDNFARVVQSYLFYMRRPASEPAAPSAPILADRISSAYLGREFERRVGLSDESFRFALNARRELTEFASRGSSDNTLWYEVLGNQPLRKVFEGALGFGTEYGKLDVDRQVEEFKHATSKLLGSSAFSGIAKPENIDRLIRTYLVRSQITLSAASDRYSTALTLLSQ